jgi:hypothetical protein
MSRRTAWPRRAAVNGIIGKIRKPGSSLDGLFPHIDWSADNDVYARVEDWSAVDKMFTHLGDLYRRHPPSGVMIDKLDGLFQPIDKLMGKRAPRRGGRGLPIANFSAGPTSDAPLQLRQFGLAAHVYPALAGRGSAVVGTLHDPLTFVLRQALRKAMKLRPLGVVRSKCGLSSTLIIALRAWMRSMMCTPSIIDLVARSHSATTSTSTVPSASIAFSSCGRPLIALPDTFSR